MKTSPGSFETPSCFVTQTILCNMRITTFLTIQLMKRVHIPEQDGETILCHLQTNMSKKASEHINFRAHTRNVAISMDKNAFSGSLEDQ